MDSPSPKQADASSSREAPPADPSSGRRALLIAVPAVFSLRQGVAAELANSSAVLVKSETETLLCAKDPGLGGNEKGWFVPADSNIEVTRFSSDSTYCKVTGTNGGGNLQFGEVQKSEMCANGGTYYVSPNHNCNNAQNLVEKNVNDGVGGAYVSALALGSFSGRVRITDV